MEGKQWVFCYHWVEKNANPKSCKSRFEVTSPSWWMVRSSKLILRSSVLALKSLRSNSPLVFGSRPPRCRFWWFSEEFSGLEDNPKPSVWKSMKIYENHLKSSQIPQLPLRSLDLSGWQEITIADCDVATFKALLQFLYTDSFTCARKLSGGLLTMPWSYVVTNIWNWSFSLLNGTTLQVEELVKSITTPGWLADEISSQCMLKHPPGRRHPRWGLTTSALVFTAGLVGCESQVSGGFDMPQGVQRYV